MTACIVLAAGQGKRMDSPLPKVMHPILGDPMVLHVCRAVRKAGFDDITVVVGYGREKVIPLLEEENVKWAVQEEQLGTAHAVVCGLEKVIADDVIVLLGDVPLIRSETIQKLQKLRHLSNAGIAVLTAFPPVVDGYGRIVKIDDEIHAIVEERDANPAEREIREINTGIMAFDFTVLIEILKEIKPDNDQSEYYLTDAVAIARKKSVKCIAVPAADWQEVAGINDKTQLANAEVSMKSNLNRTDWNI